MPHSGRTVPQGRVRACLAALGLALLALGAFGSATASALPATFWGVDPQAVPTAEQYGRLQRGGVDSIRIPVSWAAVQKTRDGEFDWSSMDTAVANAAHVGLDVLPFLYDAPSWAVPSTSLNGVRVPRFLPVRTGQQSAAWKAFLAAAVARYGPAGSFWVENPTVPMRPIHTWQIWNEENFKYFVAQPNPKEYGKLVQISYATLKGADPAAQIVLGGLFSRPKEANLKTKPPVAYFANDFLEQMYRSTPGIRAKFSGVALHPYTGSYPTLTPEVEEVREVLKRNGDGGKGLWITELGWSSQPVSRTDIFAKGMSGQAAQLKGAFKLLTAKQAKWHLKRIYWFSVDDQPKNCNFCGGTGLFGPGFVPKPAWKAYVKFAGGTVN